MLRSAADATALRDRLRPGARLVIVGAGFIGLETAATARALGVDVTVVDPAATPLEAIVGPRLGAWFAAMHRDEGVDLRCGCASTASRAPAPGPASFWSDQYATRIQLLGDPRGATELQIDGDPAGRDFTALYVRDGLVVAGLLAGRPRALPALRAQLGHPHRERNTA